MPASALNEITAGWRFALVRAFIYNFITLFSDFLLILSLCDAKYSCSWKFVCLFV